jgi:ubiquinol-cytochrome c reductase cytochrome b/c1 subunit
MMATAFIGYVLPWGQMSFWGATVITSLVTAVPLVGEDIAYWVWGGFAINNATLTRFFSLHYLLPFLIVGLVGVHLAFLHTKGSTEPMCLLNAPDRVCFHPYYSYKDSFIFLVCAAAFSTLSFYAPNLLGHADNFVPANPLVTPAHIVPEWYFTPFYAILRACPNKLGGAIGMFSAIILLFFIPFIGGKQFNTTPHTSVHKVMFWVFIGIFLTLMFLGSRAAAAPYVFASKAFTAAYFIYFLSVTPILDKVTEFIPARSC